MCNTSKTNVFYTSDGDGDDDGGGGDDDDDGDVDQPKWKHNRTKV